MATSLLDPQFLRRLERLKLQTRRMLGGQIKGERLSRRKGISIDFADYRQYSRGDDLRFIDWNIYGRLDRLFIKIFHEEQDLQCHLLIDASRSMGYGDPDKMLFARQLAAAIAYVGLTGQDKITMTAFSSQTGPRLPPSRGRHHVRHMLEYLDGLEPSGETDLATICREFTQRVRTPGVVVILSDLLDPAGHEAALRHLLHERYDVYVLHVLAPEEIDPTLQGHLQLTDVETGHQVEVTVNAQLKKIYTGNVEAWCSGIQQYCRRYGLAYSLMRSDTPLEDLILNRLRGQGLMR